MHGRSLAAAKHGEPGNAPALAKNVVLRRTIIPGPYVGHTAFIRATVPPGATTGYVTVTTPTGVLKSNVPFYVLK